MRPPRIGDGMRERYPKRVFGEGMEPDPRLSLANERTFLAWMRTALALLAGAVAVHAPAIDLDTWVKSTASMVLLLAASVAVVTSMRRWRATERAMRTGQPLPGFAGPTALAALLSVLIVGVAIGVIVVAAQ
jgi:putative membrane protein